MDMRPQISPSRGRSLRGRLLVLLAVALVSAAAVGTVLFQLYQQSSIDRVARAEAVVARECAAIADRYRFYVADWSTPPANLHDAALHRGLLAAVQVALANAPGVEGGIWHRDEGSLAYAFPTYEGAGPKTDLPAAERDRIQAANRQALREERDVETRRDGRTQTQVLHACPLAGPIAGLTAWTMARVDTAQGADYARLMVGVAVLLASVLASAWLTAGLLLTWSRKLGIVEGAIRRHQGGGLPILALTGERELDRIVGAMNAATAEIAALRRHQDELSRRVAAAERLAALGRIAAGIAHEIRNPIAAMRLKAENALLADDDRRRRALETVLGQIGRLDTLLRDLLTLTHRAEPQRRTVELPALLEAVAEFQAETAARAGVALSVSCDVPQWVLDPEPIRRALDNLVLNAVQNAGRGASVRIAANRSGSSLTLSVSDTGPGLPEAVRDHLFEPFVSGRADGTGLGLSIVREVVEAQGGTVAWRPENPGTTFELTLPAAAREA